MTVDHRSALQIAAAFGAGLADPVLVAEQTLAAIRACEDRAIFTRLTPERAMAEARASSRRHREGRPRSLLDGVPVAWKDLFGMAGLATTAASRVLESEAPAAADAPVVARLKAAGMVAVGRTNMTEFAFSGIGLNPHHGTPRNPHGTGSPRIPGGSSSGAAVSVARGLLAVSIGSDTGGSVRVPAAFNGIVGYKSSFGRYPTEGAFPLSPTLDTVGVLCRAVADAVIVDAALQGRVAPRVLARPVAGRRVLIPTNVVQDDLEPAIAANFGAAVERLAAAGAIIERTRLPAFDEIVELGARHGTIVTAEAYALHGARVSGADGDAMDRRVVARIRRGSDMGLATYLFLLRRRREMISDFAREIGSGTLIAHPTVPHVAPEIDVLEADDALFADMNMRTLRNTMLGNFLDLCGVSIPTGFDAEGLPTALLLSGAPGADDDLLAVALEAEGIVRGDDV